MQNNVDINIEFSHIYADEDFSEEHMESIKKLKIYLKNFESHNKTFTTSILIDDFNVSSLKLDEGKFLAKVRSFGVPIDFIAYESKFYGIADEIIKLLPQDKIKTEYFNSIKKEVLVLDNNGKKTGLREKMVCSQRHTCAILSSAWILCRLGCFGFPKGSIKVLSGKNIIAKELLIILPKRYKVSEDKASEIISLTKFSHVLPSIKYDYYDL